MTQGEFPAEMPATPPMQPAADQLPSDELPRVDAVQQAVVESSEPKKGLLNRMSYRSRIGSVVAGVAVSGLLLAGVASCSEDKGGDTPKTEETADPLSDDFEVCPEGIFEDGPYVASEPALPQELHVRPEAPLESTGDVVSYFYSADGVACDSAPTLATVTALSADLLGGGGPGNVFANTDINYLQGQMIENPELARNAADATAEVISKGENNEEAIVGPMFRATQEDNVVEYVEVSVSFDPNTVTVLDWPMVAGDRTAGNRDQTVVIDHEHAQIYVAKAIGAPVKETVEGPAGTTADEAEQGGGTFGETTGEGESNQPGHVPESGGNGGFTPGTVPSFGPGGGEGGPGTTAPNPTSPPETQPPHTQPPTTRPPQTTVPPTTPPTTVPPTTPPTTRPKGSEPTTTLPGGWN